MLAGLTVTDSTPPAPAQPSDLQTGQAALARGEWEAARDAFQAVLVGQEDAAALEGLGMSAWWLDLTATVFDARERAYRLYREQGDVVSAARVAVWLGWDYAAFRGESAISRGWLGLARQLLESRHDTLEYAWLSVREGVLALMDEGDAERAHLGRVELGRIDPDGGIEQEYAELE